MKKSKLLLGIPMLLAGALAHGQVIYNNLGSTSVGADPVATVGGYGPLADSFTTGSAISLNDVQLLLSLQDGAGSGGILVELLANNSNSPGALVAGIGSLADSALTASPSVYNFALGSAIPLAGDTRYWLELVSNGTTNALWSWSTDQTALGVAGEYFSNQGGVTPNIDLGPYQMSLSAVPEPETYALMVVGLGLVGLVALRRMAGRD